MTTNSVPIDYYGSGGIAYENNPNAVITTKTQRGSYNIVEKDYGDRKVIYHIPIEYGDDYDISELEDIPTEDDEQYQQNPPKLIRRRIVYPYDEAEYDEPYEYAEEVQTKPARRHIYAESKSKRDPQPIRYVYTQPPIIETLEYVNENDRDYMEEPEEIIEYVERKPSPKNRDRFANGSRTVWRPVYTDHSSPPPEESISPPPPLSYPPRRSSPPPQRSTRSVVHQQAPSQVPARLSRRLDVLSPPLSNRKQQSARSPPAPQSPVRPNIPKSNEPPLLLKDVIAQNRAKRGSRIPKPRREVDEEKVHDPPTYSRNIIKNGFIVHK